ncbi:MAG TPA: F0F1 ATP synthase subunit B [Planctomycetaceae bacterium]|jgi:F-type H+-transporting ATPase subunit b|nr:F0F1 ATP synthase subunit B [Planctomycetaceae bacterium]
MRTWIARLSVCAALSISAFLFVGGARALYAAEPGPVKQAEAAAKEAGEEMKEEGVPIKFKADLALWSAVTFLIFLFLLGRYAWKPLASALDEREGKVRSDISAAEQARLKAEEMLAQHSKKMAQVQDEIRQLLAEARRDADHAKSEIVSQAQKEAESAKQRAVQEISRARDSALKDLFDVMASEVAQATQHVLGRSVNSADQDRLIDEALAQFPRRS